MGDERRSLSGEEGGGVSRGMMVELLPQVHLQKDVGAVCRGSQPGGEGTDEGTRPHVDLREVLGTYMLRWLMKRGPKP